MGQVFSNLGINIVNIFIYVALFFVLYLVLNNFLIKNLSKVIEKREKEINQGLLNAENSKKILEDAERKQKELLSIAKRDAEVFAKKIQEETLKKQKEILDKTNSEARKMLQKAEEKIQKDREAFEKEMNSKVEVAAKIAVAKLWQEKESQFDKSLIEKAINDLKNE